MAARIGIDFGTTNTVVALSDRGNYPVLFCPGAAAGSALGRDGPQRAVPTLFAWRGHELRLGWEAWAVWEDSEWHLLGSLKRSLGQPAPDLPACPFSLEELL